MDTLIAWCGFAGAWLLVVGPLYQGALELLEEDLDRAGLDASVPTIAPPPPPSKWWWFLPPVMLVLRRRRSQEYHRTVLAQLTLQQRAQRSGFIHKATGWFVVASGGSLIAIKETWELVEHEEWPAAVFVTGVLLMFALVGGNTFLHIERRRKAAEQHPVSTQASVVPPQCRRRAGRRIRTGVTESSRPVRTRV